MPIYWLLGHIIIGYSVTLILLLGTPSHYYWVLAPIIIGYSVTLILLLGTRSHYYGLLGHIIIGYKNLSNSLMHWDNYQMKPLEIFHQTLFE